MFHTRQVVFTVYERVELQPAARDGAESLRERCLHPAEAWALRRRAGRPQAPSRRLPAVARAG
jgi:hypothetical protein